MNNKTKGSCSMLFHALLGGSLLLFIHATVAVAQGVTVPSPQDGLAAKARARGSVPIIVELRVAQALPAPPAVPSIAQKGVAIRAVGDRFLSRLRNVDVRSVKRMRYVPYMAMRINEAALTAVFADPDVVSVQEDIAVPPSLPQSTEIVGATFAWADGAAGAGQAIAILDTGVDNAHPFLSGKTTSEACYSTTDSFAQSVCPNGANEQIGPGSGVPCSSSIAGCSHGTHVAGIAAGRGTDFSGVARDATVVSIQVFSRFSGADCSTFGLPSPCALTYTSDQMRGLERVYDLRSSLAVASANMSLGGGRFTQPCNEHPLTGVVQLLRSAGVPTVMAAGNSGYADATSAPACITWGYSVGSTSKSLAVSAFSNSAPWLSFLAPGESILSSVPGGGFEFFNGTSMAAPHLAGAWAVLKSAVPTATFDQIEDALYVTSATVTVIDPRNGLEKPVVQVSRALQYLRGTPPPDLRWLPAVLDLLLGD